MSIISLKDVWEMYRIKFIIDNKPVLENFWALRDISFEVQKGEALGLIGENGSGKSTILKLISGMLKPDRGCINVSGKVSGLFELGAGFQPELTGRENVYLNFGLFGLTKDQIDDLYDEIVSFASLGKFINAPVKCYSQGMFVRLAFSIAINVNPDILLIDDSLAVGDEYFQKKCVQKVFELKDQGKTIIFVSHDMNILSRICKRVILLRNGQIVKEGLSGEVIPVYSRVVGKREGVGIIENDDLVIIFNNGRLFLNWRNKFITSGSGIYADLDINGRVYSSSQAEWDVKKESDNSFLALGKFYQLGITQEWLVELNDDGIKLRIILSSEELFELPLQSVNFMLSNEYATWFTSGENGIFPDSSEETNFWQSITKTKGAQGSVGLNAGGKTDSAPPSFILKQTESNLIYDVEIFNGNYINNGRILQCKAKRSASAGQEAVFLQ